MRWDPLSTGLGVFAAVAVPIVVVGYSLSAGPNSAVIIIGVIVGLVAGLLVGLWVAERDGEVWRGPRL